MDLKQIKELMAAMGRAGIKKVSIKEKTGFELHLESHEEGLPPTATASPFHPPYSPHPYPHPPMHTAALDIPHPSRFATAPEKERIETSSSSSESNGKAAGQYITSPMVGTFYSAASPDDPIFVKVGDVVNPDTVVCIVEAMKVMNEVKAGINGVIAEACTENGHPVEFGTKLFRIQ